MTYSYSGRSTAASQERNPERIDSQIEALRTFWKAHPNWRLTQLVSNVAEWDGCAGRITTDSYYQEDEEFFAKLGSYPYAPVADDPPMQIPETPGERWPRTATIDLQRLREEWDY